MHSTHSFALQKGSIGEVQSVGEAHSTQVLLEHTVWPIGHFVVSPVVHCTQALFEQTFASAGQADVSVAVQATHVWSLIRQTWSVQSALPAHATHAPPTQTGVPPLQGRGCQAPVLSHCRRCPPAPPQSVLLGVQATH